MIGRLRLWRTVAACIGVVAVLVGWQGVAYASPFGQGVFGANVPFGSATSLAIALGGNVALALTSNGSTMSASSSHTITVTSTDVVGYNLYAYCLSSCTMFSGANSIAASGNTTAGSLSLNTWGYNTNGSANYLGMLTTPTLLKAATGPYKSGDTTTVTYGVLTDATKPQGNYAVQVVYTVVAASD